MGIQLNSSGVLQWNTFLAGVSDRGYSRRYGYRQTAAIFISRIWLCNLGAPFAAFSRNSGCIVARSYSGDLVWNTFLGSASGHTFCTSLTVTSANVPCIGE